MIKYLTLILAIPLGALLASLTKDEKEIYSKKQYFPTLLWALAILAIALYKISEKTALTLTFIFIMIASWYKG